MHEMALVRNVLDIVLTQCEVHPTTAVRAIHLTIGELRDVIDEYIPGLFAHIARGTVAEHAEIVIHRMPYQVQCNHCKALFKPDLRDASTWVCPTCGTERDYRPYSGTEFRIDRIVVQPKPV